jgi:hypothetical protein
MFNIVWMKRGAVIAREGSALKKSEEVVRYARAKAGTGFVQAGGNEPDEFQILDDTSHEVARQQLVARRGARADCGIG